MDAVLSIESSYSMLERLLMIDSRTGVIRLTVRTALMVPELKFKAPKTA